MAILDDDMAAVKAATDIVALIDRLHRSCKRVGRRWVGLCPFHGEKTPSFSVNGEQGLYYCFGCQRSGDAITFVREWSSSTSPAPSSCWPAGPASRCATPSGARARAARQRTRLVEALAGRSDWYHQRPAAPRPMPPRPVATCARRGFDAERVRTLPARLGARRLGRARARRWRSAGDVASRTGLGLVNRSGRLQDFFRGRILFPIFDAQGDPVGFGGRMLPDADGPKYQNPREQRPLRQVPGALRAQLGQGRRGHRRRGGHLRGLHRRHRLRTGRAAPGRRHLRHRAHRGPRQAAHPLRQSAGPGLRRRRGRAGGAERFYAWEQRHDIDVAVAALPAGVDPDELARTTPRRCAQRSRGRPAVPGLPGGAGARPRPTCAPPRAGPGPPRPRLTVVAEHPDDAGPRPVPDATWPCAAASTPQRCVAGRPRPGGHAAPRAGGKRASPSTGDGRQGGPAAAGTAADGRARATAARAAPASGQPRAHGAAAGRRRPGLVREWFDPALFDDGLYRRACGGPGREASLAAALQTQRRRGRRAAAPGGRRAGRRRAGGSFRFGWPGRRPFDESGWLSRRRAGRSSLRDRGGGGGARRWHGDAGRPRPSRGRATAGRDRLVNLAVWTTLRRGDESTHVRLLPVVDRCGPATAGAALAGPGRRDACTPARCSAVVDAERSRPR